jgi:fermentation-respiration switch protein FrsA (DUF1100 family)
MALAIGIGLLLTYVGLAWFLQRGVLFPRPPLPGIDVAAALPELRQLEVGGADPVDAWFMPPLAAEPGFPVIVFAHGNYELIDHWVGEFQIPRQWGVGVLLVEYPGYGRSAGAPSQRSISESFAEAFDRLLQEPGVDPAAIIGYGRSLGGGAICQLAARRELSAMILESPFTAVGPLAARTGVHPWLVRDPFDNLTVIDSYTGPLLLLHGVHDEVIPFAHSEKLHGAAQNSQLIPMPCGHNDCPRPWPQLQKFLVEQGFLAQR